MMSRKMEIKIRLSEKELDILNHNVSLTGLSREAYLRSIIKKIIPANTPSVELVETIKQLRAIGNNLNQLVMIAHKTGSIDVMKYKNNHVRLENQIQEILRIVNQPNKMEERYGNNEDMGS